MQKGLGTTIRTQIPRVCVAAIPYLMTNNEFVVVENNRDADDNKNVKKTIGFISKTTTLYVHHAFLYISLPVFARLRREHA